MYLHQKVHIAIFVANYKIVLVYVLVSFPGTNWQQAISMEYADFIKCFRNLVTLYIIMCCEQATV